LSSNLFPGRTRKSLALIFISIAPMLRAATDAPRSDPGFGFQADVGPGLGGMDPGFGVGDLVLSG